MSAPTDLKSYHSSTIIGAGLAGRDHKEIVVKHNIIKEVKIIVANEVQSFNL